MRNPNPNGQKPFQDAPRKAQPNRMWLGIVMGLAACAVQATQPALPATPAASAAQPAASTPAVRDVQLDAPVPAAVAPAVPEGQASPPKHTAAGWLFNLGSRLLTAQDGKAGSATNRVVSPVSLASALGLVHAGTAGAAADELSDLLAPPDARTTAYQHTLPAVLQALQQETGTLTLANRVWVDASVASALAPEFVQQAQQAYRADGAVLAFADEAGASATRQINAWAAEKTGQVIKTLIPPGVLGADTRLVVTNGLHLQNAWLNRFDAQHTHDKPFAGAAKPVPTMSKFMELRTAQYKGVRLYELPLKDGAFSLVVGMDPGGDTSAATVAALGLTDDSAWQAQACTVQLPRFKLEPTSQQLKTVLMELGVKTVFTTRADFSPLLGKSAKALALDDVVQSAGIDVNEAGVDAVAATAAVMVSRLATWSNDSVCALDRPFVFAIRHHATGTPVFVGRVVSP